MPLYVLPLRAIAFQILFLLVAIAIEAHILNRNLPIPPKQSIQYSTAINLFSTVIGWLVFLNFQNLLPLALKTLIIEYIFFDQWSSDMASWIIISAFFTFFASLFFEVLGLTQLESYLGAQISPPPEIEDSKVKYKFGQRPPRRPPGVYSVVSAVLVANAVSYSAITLILLLRFLAHSNLFSFNL
jgi:hypothetical protein